MNENFQNNSGQEELSFLPPQIANKFNWGAFIFTRGWLNKNTDYDEHKKYIFKKILKFSIINYIIAFIFLFILPIICIYRTDTNSKICFYISAIVGLLAVFTVQIQHIVWGKIGNILAWQTKRWKSFEQFNKEQRKWAIYSLSYIILILLILIICLIYILSK